MKNEDYENYLSYNRTILCTCRSEPLIEHNGKNTKKGKPPKQLIELHAFKLVVRARLGIPDFSDKSAVLLYRTQRASLRSFFPPHNEKIQETFLMVAYYEKSFK